MRYCFTRPGNTCFAERRYDTHVIEINKSGANEAEAFAGMDRIFVNADCSCCFGYDQLSRESGASHKRMVQPLDAAYAFYLLFLPADHGGHLLCVHHAAGTE